MNSFGLLVFLVVVFLPSCALRTSVLLDEGTCLKKKNISKNGRQQEQGDAEAVIAFFKKDVLLKSGAKVSVSVSVSKYVVEDPMYSEPLWWGTELVPPKTFIKELSVHVDENICWIPLSAYSDLVNIKSVDLRILNEGFNIIIDGGDTATYYKAVLSFDNEGYLLRRMVYNPSFPDEIWEETNYSFIRRKDM